MWTHRVCGESTVMAEMIDIHLGRQLRRRRRILGLSQMQLATLCKLGFQQIQKYEVAANKMSAARLWQLAKVLEVPVDYFFEGFSQESQIEKESKPRQPTPAL
jgi:transcriptional regulator with XRE-family HTH domain